MIRIPHKPSKPHKQYEQYKQHKNKANKNINLNKFKMFTIALITFVVFLATSYQIAYAQEKPQSNCRDYLRQHVSFNKQDELQSKTDDQLDTSSDTYKPSPVPPPNQPGAVKTVDVNDQLDKPVNIYFFTSQDCKTCPEIRDNLYEFDEMNEKATLKEYEITQLIATYLLQNAENVLGIDLKNAPIIFIGTYPVVGECNIYNEVPYLLQDLIDVSNGNTKSLIDDIIKLGGTQRLLTAEEIENLKEEYNIVDKTKNTYNDTKPKNKEIAPTPQPQKQQAKPSQISFFERLILFIKHVLGM